MYPIKLQKTGMLTIQKVTVADCELINKMAGEVFPATYKEILSPEQLDYMMDWMYAPENIRKQMEEEGHVYFIAYKETDFYAEANRYGDTNTDRKGKEIISKDTKIQPEQSIKTLFRLLFCALCDKFYCGR